MIWQCLSIGIPMDRHYDNTLLRQNEVELALLHVRSRHLDAYRVAKLVLVVMASAH